MNALESALCDFDTHADINCSCAPGNYCGCHGEYTPSTLDWDVLDILGDNARNSRHGRVIRKPLPN